MKKAIIFDMDGVLVDSEPAITYASIEVLKNLGITAKPEEFKPFTGMGDDKFIAGVLEAHGGKYDPKYKEAAYRIYIDTAKDNIKVYGWSKKIITELKSKGYSLAVASASDISKVRCNLECIGIDVSLFDAIVTGSDVKNKKPAPDIFLKAAEKAGFDPRYCIVAEDAVAGIMAAKAAGMYGVAVTTSFPEAELKNAGADVVTNDLNNLPKIADEIFASFS